MTTSGWLRDLWRRWRLQHWAARARYPARLRRKYGSEDEQKRDTTRLTEHGYRVVIEEDSGATVNLGSSQNVYSRGPTVLPYELPLAVVTYERDPRWR
ncbi:MAG: hypothetical protein WB802_02015 [Candidatus Dormiibacterota bacterium]